MIKKNDRYQGDPRIIVTEDGTTIEYQGGQPVMDGGIENAIVLSLFVTQGWPCNILFGKPEEKLGSDFMLEMKKSITLETLNSAADAAKKSLQWMVDVGLASEIQAAASNPSYNRVDVRIFIKYPGSDIDEFLASRNADNWLFQKDDPAYKRITNGV